MKQENWKEEFEQQFGGMPLWRPKGEKLEVYGRLVNFIESLLVEERNKVLDLAKEEKEKWVKIFDYHSDMSNERHSAMRNIARVEIQYWENYLIKK
jgi:hypothetical protein